MKMPAWTKDAPSAMGSALPNSRCVLCYMQEDVWTFFYGGKERDICRGCAETYCGMGKRWEYIGGGSVALLGEQKA